MNRPSFVRFYNLETELVAINPEHIMFFKEETDQKTQNVAVTYLEVMMVSGEVLSLMIRMDAFMGVLRSEKVIDFIVENAVNTNTESEEESGNK